MAFGCGRTWCINATLFLAFNFMFNQQMYCKAIVVSQFRPPDPYLVFLNSSTNFAIPYADQYLRYSPYSSEDQTIKSDVLVLGQPEERYEMQNKNVTEILLWTSTPTRWNAYNQKPYIPSMTQDIMEYLFAHYRRHERPDTFSGLPTTVYVFIHILAMSSINVVQMEYTVDLYLRQTWNDPRLAWNTVPELQNYKDSILITQQRDKLWLPDLFFRNGKSGFIHDVSLPNYLIRVTPDGNVLYSQKITMVLSCSMYLKKFPFDQQQCQMNIGSYGYTVDELKFVWREEAVTVSENLQLLEFANPREASTLDCTINGTTSTGTYSCLLLTLSLQRLVTSYLVTTYIPEVLIVMVSWLGFWIDVKVAPARVALGLFTLLGLLTESSSVSSMLPRVTYVKAIDVWITVCLLFVIGALLEFALAYVFAPKDTSVEWQSEALVLIQSELKETLSDIRCCCCYTKSTKHKPIRPLVGRQKNIHGNSGGIVERNHAAKSVKASNPHKLMHQSGINSIPKSRTSSNSRAVCAACESIQPPCCQCPQCKQLVCPKAPKRDPIQSFEIAERKPQRSNDKRRIVICERAEPRTYSETAPSQRLLAEPKCLDTMKPRKSVLKNPLPESYSTVQYSEIKVRTKSHTRIRINRISSLLFRRKTRTISRYPMDKLKQLSTNEIYDSEVDAYSRFLFPACFLLFNCAYWFFYLIISNA